MQDATIVDVGPGRCYLGRGAEDLAHVRNAPRVEGPSCQPLLRSNAKAHTRRRSTPPLGPPNAPSK
jgi:hypothetical protein